MLIHLNSSGRVCENLVVASQSSPLRPFFSCGAVVNDSADRERERREGGERSIKYEKMISLPAGRRLFNHDACAELAAGGGRMNESPSRQGEHS